jgi:hypothetical protein
MGAANALARSLLAIRALARVLRLESTMKLTFLALAVATLTACAGQGAPRVEGRMASGGGYLGDWDLYPNRCTRVRDGIVLDRDEDPRHKVRLIDRSRGTSSTLSKVEVRLDNDTPDGPVEVLLTDATCVTGSFEARGPKPTGSLKFDCMTGEGGHVIGSVDFEGCR